MKPCEIKEKLIDIKNRLDRIFETETVDFDELDRDITTVIEAVEKLEDGPKSVRDPQPVRSGDFR